MKFSALHFLEENRENWHSFCNCIRQKVIGSFIFVLSAGLVYCRFFLHVSHQSTSATSFVLEISSESNNQTTSIELPTISPETPVFFDDVNAEDNKAAEATLLLHTFSEQNLQ